MKFMYCRGCNRAFEVAEETKLDYIERSDEYGLKRHPKQDCDEVMP